MKTPREERPPHRGISPGLLGSENRREEESHGKGVTSWGGKQFSTGRTLDWLPTQAP